MLVVISGVETLHKRLIARQIIARMNEFVFEGGWKLDLNDDTLSIIGPDGQPVDIETFVSKVDRDGQEALDERGALFKKMTDLEEHLFQQSEIANHFYHKFCSPEYDRGISPVIIYEDPNDAVGFPYACSYEELLENYRNSNLEYFPITGIFGKVFINKLRQDLGAENVLVYNITRNPSVVFALQNKIPNFTDNQIFHPEVESEKMYKSLYNAAILKEDPSVTTIKFEDMISTGEFVIDGKDVGLYLDYNSANGLLTRFEYDNILPRLEVTNDMVANFNQTIQPCLMRTLGNPLDGPNGECMAETKDPNPWNLFEKLGYEPLTFDQIRNS